MLDIVTNSGPKPHDPHFSPPSRPCDVSRPSLIFAGLLLTATVVCGAIDLNPSNNSSVIQDLEVAHAELAIGPDEFDLIAADCDPKDTHLGHGEVDTAQSCSKNAKNSAPNVDRN